MADEVVASIQGRHHRIATAVALAACGCALMNGALLLHRGDVWDRVVTAITLLGVVGLLSAWRERRRLLRPTAVGVLIGLLSAALLYAAAWLVLRLSPALPQAQVLSAWRGDHGGLFLGVTVVIAVAGEELFWRGAVTRLLVARMPGVTAAVVSAGLFALAHVASGTWLLPFAAFGAGLVWNLLFVTTGNLTASLVSHLVWDLLVVVFAPLV